MLRYTIILLISLVSFKNIIAQNGYEWGANKPDAQARWQYMNFLIDEKKYNQAAVPLNWLLVNTPNLHEDLYKLGTKVYEELEENEVNRSYRVTLQDSILMIYDKRFTLFGDEANVMNRKGLVAYKYLSPRSGMEDSVFAIYKRIYTLNKQNTYTSCAYYYMSAACDLKKDNKITNDEILEVYAEVSGVFDQNIAAESNSKKKESLEKFKEKIDGKLTQCATISCDYAISKWGKDTSIVKLKMAYSILVANKCTSKPEFISISSKILEAEPSALGYKSLADDISDSNTEKALNFYQKAIDIADDNELKGAIYVKMANIYSKSSKSKSREYARKAIALGQHTKEAHTLIGNLYVASYDDCKNDNPVESRALFIAAYNEYAKAGNSARMTELKANFPSKEEIFLHQKKAGDAVTVGCWIGESVTLQTRD